MTIEEAIKTIELAIAEVEWVYPIDYAAAFDVAISALRAQQELESNLKVLESNEPLTVDELRKMDGEPVWTVGVSYTRDGTFSMWDIIESVNENGIHFGYSDEYVEWWNYGLKNMDGNLFGWIAYRRKPEEV